MPHGLESREGSDCHACCQKKVGRQKPDAYQRLNRRRRQKKKAIRERRRILKRNLSTTNGGETIRATGEEPADNCGAQQGGHFEEKRLRILTRGGHPSIWNSGDATQGKAETSFQPPEEKTYHQGCGTRSRGKQRNTPWTESKKRKVDSAITRRKESRER